MVTKPAFLFPTSRQARRLCAAAVLAMTPAVASAQDLGGGASTTTAAAAPAAPHWTEGDAQALIGALQNAARHGLSARRYLAALDNLPSGPARDQALTDAALTYARALAFGAVDPTRIHEIFTLRRNQANVTAGLRQAVAAGNVAPWLESLAPQDAEYRALSAAYLRARAQADRSRPGEVPDGPLIRPGDRDGRLPAIARRLADLGVYTSPPSSGSPRRYGPDLVRAVKALQTDRGIAVDGVVGPDTLTALNAGPADRARTLAVNLERRRWLARNPPATRIDVNLAAATLRYWRDGSPAWSTRVVVGAPDRRTPLLEETFDDLVVNPPWYVPQSIAESEILPKGRAYLVSKDMYVEDGRVIQRPGPQAALGVVKFDMQNPYAIYLHDTPAKSLFDTADRHRSHGCVRVQDAVAFARMLAQAHGKGEAFDQALNSGKTQVVDLGAAIPVRLLYETAFLDDDGQIAFRPDSYGWDDKVAEQLGLGPAGPRRAEPILAAPLGP